MPRCSAAAYHTSHVVSPILYSVRGHWGVELFLVDNKSSTAYCRETLKVILKRGGVPQVHSQSVGNTAGV